ncbi:hypothetical protein NC651_026425 [Populus alba x Populus x berolinensis]|nr:hypothetical protein NC651_026425 [Populus alba x Populus x berolinensis]
MDFGALDLRDRGSGRLRFVGFLERVWGGRRFPLTDLLLRWCFFRILWWPT